MRRLRRLAVLCAALVLLPASPAAADVAPRASFGGVMVPCPVAEPDDPSVATLVAHVCGLFPSSGARADTYPCVDGLDVYYDKVTVYVNGAPSGSRFEDLFLTARIICRPRILECVAVGFVGGAPPVILGWGSPPDGRGTECFVRPTSPRASGPIPSGMVIVTGVYTTSLEAYANWHGYFIK